MENKNKDMNPHTKQHTSCSVMGTLRWALLVISHSGWNTHACKWSFRGFKTLGRDAKGAVRSTSMMILKSKAIFHKKYTEMVLYTILTKDKWSWKSIEFTNQDHKHGKFCLLSAQLDSLLAPGHVRRPLFYASLAIRLDHVTGRERKYCSSLSGLGS